MGWSVCQFLVVQVFWVCKVRLKVGANFLLAVICLTISTASEDSQRLSNCIWWIASCEDAFEVKDLRKT